MAREAEHVFESLTCGEGPRAIRQGRLQQWLWYVLPTKYLNNELGCMNRMAAAAAELFGELGLDVFAGICRSETTAEVFQAYDRSRSAGLAAMRKAIGVSGVDPPDVEGFEWGSVMGMVASRYT